jgi:hypothetical protein
MSGADSRSTRVMREPRRERLSAYAAKRGLDLRTSELRQVVWSKGGHVDATLATEATRYLEVIDLFRSMELDVKWRCEADEVGALTPVPEMQRPRECNRCASPHVRINGRHICLAPRGLVRSA